MSRKEKKKKEKTKKAEQSSTGVPFEDKRSSSGAGSGGGEQAETSEEEAALPDGGDVEGKDDRHAAIVDQLKRLQAEFDNYRKRVQRERAESWSMAKRDLVMSLLPVVDDMRRINEWDDEEVEARALLDGMKLTARKLSAILEDEGFEVVEAVGRPFDPNFHEALLTQDVSEPDRDNIIDDVLVEGYLFKGVLIRPARVRVLKFKDEDDAGNEEDDHGGETGGEIEDS